MARSTSPSPTRRLGVPALGALLVVSAALSGAFAGCSGGSRGTNLTLSLAPDSTCAAAPVSCVNELQVVFEDDAGQSLATWTINPFAVDQSSASLGDVPKSGTGRFRANGRASLVGISPVILFTGQSDPVTLSGKKDQRVVVPVSCSNVPDPCLATPTATPDPFARFPAGAPADALVGQASFGQCANNAVAAQNGQTDEPDGLWLTSTQLWVMDRGNSRLGVFDRGDIGTLPVPLAFIEGHTQKSEEQQGSSSDDFRFPRGFAIDQTADLLYVADTNNHRGMIFGPIPNDMSDPPADLAIGQNNPGNNNTNAGGGVGDDTLNAPWSVLLVPGGVFVADTGNHRLLHFARPVAGNRPAASGVCGQASFTVNQQNRDGSLNPTRSSMRSPAHLATDGTRLYLADTGNHRVLVWNDFATAAAGGDPSFVLGQASFTSGLPNRGGTPDANTLSGPRGVAASPVRLVVTDSDNHRVLVWQPPPVADGAPATEVIGQDLMTANTANHDPSTAGNCPATNTCPALNNAPPRDVTLFRPGAALMDGDQLWVSDTCNHRVLRFTAVPP